MSSQQTNDPAQNLPADGPGAVGRLMPRCIALFIDWVLCSLIAIAFLDYRLTGGSGGEGFRPMAIFAVENILLVSTLGTTIGHRMMGLVVTRSARVAAGDLTPGAGLLGGVVRTVLLLLVVPALITDQYGRGLHDKIAGTIILRTR